MSVARAGVGGVPEGNQPAWVGQGCYCSGAVVAGVQGSAGGRARSRAAHVRLSLPRGFFQSIVQFSAVPRPAPVLLGYALRGAGVAPRPYLAVTGCQAKVGDVPGGSQPARVGKGCYLSGVGVAGGQESPGVGGLARFALEWKGRGQACEGLRPSFRRDSVTPLSTAHPTRSGPVCLWAGRQGLAGFAGRPPRFG